MAEQKGMSDQERFLKAAKRYKAYNPITPDKRTPTPIGTTAAPALALTEPLQVENMEPSTQGISDLAALATARWSPGLNPTSGGDRINPSDNTMGRYFQNELGDQFYATKATPPAQTPALQTSQGVPAPQRTFVPPAQIATDEQMAQMAQREGIQGVSTQAPVPSTQLEPIKPVEKAQKTLTETVEEASKASDELNAVKSKESEIQKLETATSDLLKLREKAELEYQQKIEAISNRELDAGRIFRNMSTPNKIIAGLAIAAGAVGSALQGRGDNPAFNYIMNAINQDIDIQKEIKSAELSAAREGRKLSQEMYNSMIEDWHRTTIEEIEFAKNKILEMQAKNEGLRQNASLIQSYAALVEKQKQHDIERNKYANQTAQEIAKNNQSLISKFVPELGGFSATEADHTKATTAVSSLNAINEYAKKAIKQFEEGGISNYTWSSEDNTELNFNLAMIAKEVKKLSEAGAALTPLEDIRFLKGIINQEFKGKVSGITLEQMKLLVREYPTLMKLAKKSYAPIGIDDMTYMIPEQADTFRSMNRYEEQGLDRAGTLSKEKKPPRK